MVLKERLMLTRLKKGGLTSDVNEGLKKKLVASSGVTIHIPYDSTQFDYYLKLSISIISIQLSKILMFFFLILTT